MAVSPVSSSPPSHQPSPPKPKPTVEVSSERMREIRDRALGSGGGKQDINDLPAATRKGLADEWKKWAKPMVPSHERWHQQNGTGGTEGKGSGEKFMQFHANLMNDFKSHLKKTNPELLKKAGSEVPSWDTSKALPKEFHFKGMEQSRIDAPIPGWATEKGNGRDAVTLEGSRTPIRKLNDIKNPDELGRALGESGFHAEGHSQLGGPMAGFASVGEAPFMLWHGKMEEIRTAWKGTESGRAWMKAHPSGWTQPGANSHSHHA
jgi:hypothetical protein